MAEKTEKPHAEATPSKQPATAQPTTSTEASAARVRKSVCSRILTRRTLLVAAAGLAAFPLAVGALARLQPSEPTREIELGTYRFEGPADPHEVIVGAEFQVYVTLLQGVEDRGRTLLQRNRQRVRQNLQQLLREARGRDFIDPQLLGLKRQIRETLNGTLQLRAVEDVIITDLELTRALPPSQSLPRSPVTDEDALGGRVSATSLPREELEP